MKATSFADMRVRLTDLVTPEDPLLHNVVFDRCVIDGPALVQPMGCQFADNDYGIDNVRVETALWTVHPWSGVLTGAVVARNCIFRHCTFGGVAFAGEPELIASLRAAIPNERRAS